MKISLLEYKSSLCGCDSLMRLIREKKKHFEYKESILIVKSVCGSESDVADSCFGEKMNLNRFDIKSHH